MIGCYDFLVIGGGIAGSSIAASLAEHASVRLLEREERPGYHSTGRSAALFSEVYGNGLIRALTRASRDAFHAPPSSFCSVELVKPRDVLMIAREDQRGAIERLLASALVSGAIARASREEALSLCPVLRPEAVADAALVRGTSDIDVDVLHQAYLRRFRDHGGTLSTAAEVRALQRDGEGWIVETSSGTVRASVVVNAAGAWAGEIAAIAGARDVGLRPLRRTACLIHPPQDFASGDWPMIVNVEEEFYLKPEAGMLLLSPADATETNPCDAQPDELDIAIAIDRVERATTLTVSRVAHKWAGLRSFVADSSPVVGYDPLQPGFFWLAALGGYGIQTAPALGRIAASLALGRAIDSDLQAFGIDVAAMASDRLLAPTTDDHVIGVAAL